MVARVRDAMRRRTPWLYETGRHVKLLWGYYWPEILGGIVGAILCAALGCSRGGACKPPQRAQSESTSGGPHTCEVRR